MNIFKITLCFLTLTFLAQSEEINFRGSSAAIINKGDIKIRIGQEMLNTENFKEIPKKYSGIKSYAGLIDKKVQKRRKRKFRGGGDIYTDFSDTVVYIGNYEGESVGAGFLIDKAGLILTNWHVIDKANQVAVWTLPVDGAPSEYVLFEELDPMIGTVVATNKLEDLAIIKVGNFPQKINPVTLGSIKDIRIGDKVYAIGHPEGLPWTFTDGTVSQIRKNHKWKYKSGSSHKATLIQTQTPINPGNSGGPLFSESGKLIGINTLQAGGQNLNFAVSVEHAKNFINKNPDIKKVNPGASIMKKDYPNAKVQDYNKNGTIDTWYIDENKNGTTDTAFIDDNEDGIIEAILIDENENGIWEIQIMDDDNDGNPDRAFLDNDEDKKIDAIAYDYDQDGTWDKFEKVS
jgi:S1-C subfamily serine protease